MSHALICDGCGALVSSAHSRGRLRRLDYCEACLSVVDDRTQALAALHLQVAQAWREGLERIDGEARAKCPAIKLPL